jgi:hypothetical protein
MVAFSFVYRFIYRYNPISTEQCRQTKDEPEAAFTLRLDSDVMSCFASVRRQVLSSSTFTGYNNAVSNSGWGECHSKRRSK